MTLANYPWRHWARFVPQKVALQTQHGEISWQQLANLVDNLATSFHHQGVNAGMGVALRGRNSMPLLLSWLALLQCGARVLPLNPQLPDTLLEALIPSLSIHFALSFDCDAVPGPVVLHYQPLTGEWAEPWQPERFVSMTLTSGSTGLPKAAVHTATAQLASARGVTALMSFERDDCWLLSLPLFHVSGQGILWRWLATGAAMALRPDQPLPQALQGCTHASLVPTQLWRLLADNPVSLGNLKAVLLGGAAIPVALTDEAQQRGIACWCGYGMTEMASTVTAKRANGRGDVGQPLAGREVCIVDNEVWLRGDSLAAGYWHQGHLLPLLNSAGWFATRDRGTYTDNTLTIHGRLDNLFFSGGESIQPEEVERVIMAHPQVQQVIVVPRADEEFGHRPVAVVELVDASALVTLSDWVRDKLARFQQPVQWLLLPDVLRQGGIKIARNAVMQWVAEQE
ncbi:o-succinylbenzoate--CoA ligase [Mangrovibacter phragmitis]|uniref:o-succinylbenzoate--CoA ligase n=1 Tax=Mangrovibacter phragmitis TaxID=1691903 RepID=UPI00336A060A